MAKGIRSLSLDAKKTLKGDFKPSSRAERDFYRSLKKVAQNSAHIVETFVDGIKILNETQMMKALEEYSKLITPWAERQAIKLLNQVQKSNKRAYTNKSKAIGSALQEGIASREVGAVALKLINEQVALIKSIPVEAGLRAQKIAYEGVLHGTRAQPNEDTIKELQEQMGMTEEVAVSRAQLIAVTETARSNAAINQSRAMAVGSNQYRWHNSHDGAVRKAHKTLKGKPIGSYIFSWDDPPTLDDGTKGHPGTFPRCRCFAEPIFEND